MLKNLFKSFKDLFSKKYLEYFKIGFRTSIEYKSYILSILITPLFFGFFFYFIWGYIYDVKGELIAGLTFNEMMVYLIIGLLINTTRNSEVSDKISQIIRSGDITTYLCRPVSFIKSLVFENFGNLLINFLMFLCLLIFITYFFGVAPPTGFMLIIFLFYGILMVFFNIMTYIIIGGLSFWFVEIWGIRASIEQIIWVLSGRILPLNLFPVWAQTFLAFTPFLYLEYTFAMLFLGKIDLMASLKAIIIFFFWNIFMILLMVLLYKKAYKKLQSFGG